MQQRQVQQQHPMQQQNLKGQLVYYLQQQQEKQQEQYIQYGRMWWRLKTKGDNFGRLVNAISNDMPFGPTADMAHIVLANAIRYSLWCGWFSQAMINKKNEKFSAEYAEKFQKAIEIFNRETLILKSKNSIMN
jgi:hypothetical protein